MSNTMAHRQHGLCQGCLYRSTFDPSASLSYSSPSAPKVYEYCVLVGVQFICYESYSAFERGQAPMASFNIVGASMAGNSKSIPSASSLIGNSSFRLVSNQGTHLQCTAPTTACRDVWLRALAAGLEGSLAALGSSEEIDGNSSGSLNAMGLNENMDGTREILKRVKPRFSNNRSKSLKYCHSCGKVERLEFPLVLASRPLIQYGIEDRRDLCHKCDIAQGMLDHCYYLEDLYAAAQQERSVLLQARAYVVSKLQPRYPLSDTEPAADITITSLSHHILQKCLRGSQCVAFSRTSPILDDLGLQFQQGLIGVLEFVEFLEHAVGIKDKQMGMLKTQAFRVAGDMGTALKLLHDCTQKTYDIELLQSILEFFLDLLEEGELKTLAFFWPQICNIHLQMLPPTDASSLMRIELVEDFLLTVATQHSIHLAIELIWCHTADLEDSRTLPICLRRKYAVLRFLCELESLLFDFETGWGGGSVTVGQFLSPSNHQISCLKKCMQRIQNYRLDQRDYLSRSRRLTKLRKARDRKFQKNNTLDLMEEDPEKLAEEALRIAKNADYLSSHLVFTKRLCDIAERLRFLDIDQRASFLRQELSKLNASGAMGGDPLNTVKDDHSRVVRIPIGEGHVFRSKERTPVLLLVEINDEGMENPTGPVNSFPKRLSQSDEKETKPSSEDEKKETRDEGDTEQEENVTEKSDAAETVTVGGSQADGESLPKAPVENGKHPEDSTVEASENGKDATESRRSLSDDPGEDDEFLSAAGSDCGSFVEPMKTGSEDDEKKVVLSGSMDGLEDDLGRSARHALRRFDSPKGEPKVITPCANKETVESLVTEVVAKQLHLPSLVGSKAPTREESKAEQQPLEISNKESQITDPVIKTSKVSTLVGKTSGAETNNPLSKTGDVRREVLTAIMQKGMAGDHSIAVGAATAAQRHLQDLERRRAVELLLTGEDYIGESSSSNSKRSDRQELLSLGIRSASTDDLEGSKPELSEDDEVMEAIRLLLIQYQVAKGGLSLNDAAAVLAPRQSWREINRRKSHEGTMMHFGKEFPEIEAGDIDPRLVGCGVLPPAVLQALTLWKASMITNGELLELVKKDLEFVKNSFETNTGMDKLNEDSAFWGRFAFGERWAEKRSRIAASSPESTQPGWDLIGIIVKSNDDLRQEAFVMQLIELCKEAFEEAGLELWLLPYRILSTGRTTGIIEMVRNAMSIDALKKRPGYGKGGLRDHLRRMTDFAADPGEAYKTAQHNFVRSLAAYSLLSYLFLFKDRHNGNILLDTAGHIIHIDFGFVFGIAPGGSFSLEMSTPFKLTEEMIEVMDGLRSSHFSEFVTLFCCGFLALQAHSDTFLTLIEITCRGSTFKCFEGRKSVEVLEQMKERLRPDLNKEETIAFCLDIIKESTQSYGTAQYDYFQYLSQGIAT